MSCGRWNSLQYHPEAVPLRRRQMNSKVTLSFSVLLVVIALSTNVRAEDYFNGYPCIEDCSGHEAGYKWAEQKDISDPDGCGGNSQSFIEGCRSYVEQQASDQQEDNEDSDTDNSDD